MNSCEQELITDEELAKLEVASLHRSILIQYCMVAAQVSKTSARIP